MRFTTIAFNAKTQKLVVRYQTPNTAQDGWILHSHEGKFGPGPAFQAALSALDIVCSDMHEVITVAGTFTPEETPKTGRVRAVEWAGHPVQARKVHFYRKEKSALVQVMIPGYRSITSGGFSLPGVKLYLDPGDDDEHDTLFLSPGQTKKIEALQEATMAMLPQFIAYLAGEGETAQGRLPLGDGDGSLPTVALMVSGEFFDDDVREQAEALAKTLTDFQAKILLEMREARDAGGKLPEAHSFKGNRKKAVTALEKRHILRNGQGRLHLTEDGWNVSEVLRRTAAEV